MSYSTTLNALPIRFSTHCPGTNYILQQLYCIYYIIHNHLRITCCTKPLNNPLHNYKHKNHTDRHTDKEVSKSYQTCNNCWSLLHCSLHVTTNYDISTRTSSQSQYKLSLIQLNNSSMTNDNDNDNISNKISNVLLNLNRVCPTMLS